MRSLLVALCLITAFACNAGTSGTVTGEAESARGDRPTLYTATYTARYNGLPITARRTLSRTENGYQLVLSARNFLGHITEEEHFTCRDGYFHLRDYRYERQIFGKSAVETLAFDPATGDVTSERKGETETLPWSEDLLGPLSHQQQLQADMMAGAETLTYKVAQRGRIKTYRYGILGGETLETPLGRLDTVKLERLRDDDERQTFVWLAEDLDFLLVKLEQHEDGESHELLIKTYTEQQ